MAAESTGDIDKRLAANLTTAHRARWIAVITLAVLLVAGIASLGVVVAAQARQLSASCDFYRLIATSPVMTKPQPGRLGIELLIDSRNTYSGQGCGSLPPPSASLRRWAAIYHLPLNR